MFVCMQNVFHERVQNQIENIKTIEFKVIFLIRRGGGERGIGKRREKEKVTLRRRRRKRTSVCTTFKYNVVIFPGIF